MQLAPVTANQHPQPGPRRLQIYIASPDGDSNI